jgi:hypothetical protein
MERIKGTKSLRVLAYDMQTLVDSNITYNKLFP